MSNSMGWGDPLTAPSFFRTTPDPYTYLPYSPFNTPYTPPPHHPPPSPFLTPFPPPPNFSLYQPSFGPSEITHIPHPLQRPSNSYLQKPSLVNSLTLPPIEPFLIPSSVKHPFSPQKNSYKHSSSRSSRLFSTPRPEPLRPIKQSNNVEPPIRKPKGPLEKAKFFTKGSLIQLADGKVKYVEDMTTDDFIQCAKMSPDLKLSYSTVVSIVVSSKSGSANIEFSVGDEQTKFSLTVPEYHPFYVIKHGWSSCDALQTSCRFGLKCRKMEIGDMCVSLSMKEVNNKEQGTKSLSDMESSSELSPPRTRRWSAPEAMDTLPG